MSVYPPSHDLSIGRDAFFKIRDIAQIYGWVFVSGLAHTDSRLWTAPCIYFACAIENNVSCKSLEKLILFFSAKVFSHAGIVRFFLTAFSPYFSS